MLLYLISKRGLAFNLSQLGTFLIWSSYAWRGETELLFGDELLYRLPTHVLDLVYPVSALRRHPPPPFPPLPLLPHRLQRLLRLLPPAHLRPHFQSQCPAFPQTPSSHTCLSVYIRPTTPVWAAAPSHRQGGSAPPSNEARRWQRSPRPLGSTGGRCARRVFAGLQLLRHVRSSARRATTAHQGSHQQVRLVFFKYCAARAGAVCC